MRRNNKAGTTKQDTELTHKVDLLYSRLQSLVDHLYYLKENPSHIQSKTLSIIQRQFDGTQDTYGRKIAGTGINDTVDDINKILNQAYFKQPDLNTKNNPTLNEDTASKIHMIGIMINEASSLFAEIMVNNSPNLNIKAQQTASAATPPFTKPSSPNRKSNIELGRTRQTQPSAAAAAAPATAPTAPRRGGITLGNTRRLQSEVATPKADANAAPPSIKLSTSSSSLYAKTKPAANPDQPATKPDQDKKPAPDNSNFKNRR